MDKEKGWSIQARAHVFGDHVNTDLIIAGRYCHLPSAADMAEHVFEDLDESFQERFRNGDVIVAGKDFGCGSSREEAPAALKALGVSCVVAESFARIFFRNCVNMGLPILECPGCSGLVTDGDLLKVDVSAGKVFSEDGRLIASASPFPPFMRRLVEAGGLVAEARTRLARAAEAGDDR